MSSIIVQKDPDQIPCQFNHRSPIQFYVLDITKENKVTLFCQECLTMMTLPQNAKLFDKAKQQMIQQRQLSLELVKMLIQKQVQQIEHIEKEIDIFKSSTLQQLKQSEQDIKFWRQEIECIYAQEKALDFEQELKSLHLNQEEYKIKEHIRLEKKILNFNQSYNKKITDKLHQFLNLDKLQTCKQLLDQSINQLQLNNLFKEQEEFQLRKTQIIKQLPNLSFLRGNFEHIQENIKCHILNWRTYRQNSVEIAKFYNDMNDNSDFLSHLFPNFYRSQYHPNSIRLTPQERNEIIKDDQVTKQLIENFQMYLCSSGVQLLENKIVVQNKQQLKQFKNNIKNLQGVQRVISSLSVLNQRSNALLLVRFTKEIDYFYNETFINYDLLQEEGNQDEQALKFQNVKAYFVQSDIVDKQWVTHHILTNQILDI